MINLPNWKVKIIKRRDGNVSAPSTQLTDPISRYFLFHVYKFIDYWAGSPTTGFPFGSFQLLANFVKAQILFTNLRIGCLNIGSFLLMVKWGVKRCFYGVESEKQGRTTVEVQLLAFLIKLLMPSMVNLLFLHHVKSKFKYGWRVAECSGERIWKQYPAQWNGRLFGAAPNHWEP